MMTQQIKERAKQLANKVKELVGQKVGDKAGNNGEEKSTLQDLQERLDQAEGELRQVEAEYHKRIGKIELIRDLLKGV